MDGGEHGQQRKTVAPAFSPSEMARLTNDSRRRTAELLNELPIGESIDWVDKVSIELTTQMLAVLFDFPWEDRRLLPFWSDVASNIEQYSAPEAQEERLRHLTEMGTCFQRLWDERRKRGEAEDLLSRMIHSEAMGRMNMCDLIGAYTSDRRRQ